MFVTRGSRALQRVQLTTAARALTVDAKAVRQLAV
jgi:hypothetical protein